MTKTRLWIGLQSKEPLARSSMGNMRHADPVWNVVWRPADLQVSGSAVSSLVIPADGVVSA